MGLLNGDHQGAGRVAGLLGLLVVLDFPLVEAADATGDDVGYQHVIQRAAVASELEDDVLALIQRLHHIVNDIKVGLLGYVSSPLDGPELALQGGGGLRVGTAGLAKRLHPIGRHPQQFLQPILPVDVVEKPRRGRRGGTEVQLVSQQHHVLGLDLIETDLEGHVHVLASSGLLVQRVDHHTAAEDLTQPLDPYPIFRLLVKSVLAVHVEDEIDGRLRLYDAREDDASQEALARARLAEDAVGALHQAVELDADGNVHGQRCAQGEIPPALLAKDAAKVHSIGLAQLGEVHGYSAHRLRRRQLVEEGELVTLLQHEPGSDLHRSIGTDA